MNYKKIYNNLIDKRKNNIPAGYKEKHHIIPKCIGGTDNSENLIFLTPEEHFLAHLLLWKIHKNNKLLSAIMMMTADPFGNRINNKSFGWLRRKWANHMRQHNPNKNGITRKKYCKLHGSPNKGKKYNMSKAGRKKLQRTGSKNPMYKIKPWKHGRATTYTKSIWHKAQILYEIWIKNNKPSYARMFNLDTGLNYSEFKTGRISPYINMCKYFKNGWIPKDDMDWIDFNKNYKV